jgi:hypothetical protein
MAARTKKKDAPKRASPADGGGAMFKLLFYLAILAGVGYAAARVPVAGRTVFQHAGSLLADRAAPLAARPAAAKAAESKPAGPKPAEPKPPAKAPAGPRTADARRPAEAIDAADRAALDRLLPR